MRVKMLQDHREPISALSTKVYPKDSTPMIDDDVAEDWIKKGLCEPLLPEAGSFTPEQTAVLGQAANQIIKAQQGQGDGAEQIVLDNLTDEQLAELAEGYGLDIKGQDRETVIAAIEEADEFVASLESGEVDLEKLSDDEIKTAALRLGIKAGNKQRKTLVAAIEKQLADDEVSDADDGAAE